MPDSHPVAQPLSVQAAPGGLGRLSVQPRRGDVYVFALLAHLDKATIHPTNVDQRRFFVVPTATLDARTRSQHSITLASLRAIARELRLAELAGAVTAGLLK